MKTTLTAPGERKVSKHRIINSTVSNVSPYSPCELIILQNTKNILIQAYFGPRLISPSNDPAANSSPEPIQFVQELHKAMAGIETLQK